MQPEPETALPENSTGRCVSNRERIPLTMRCHEKAEKEKDLSPLWGVGPFEGIILTFEESSRKNLTFESAPASEYCLRRSIRVQQTQALNS
jgi:hypothetical protein